MSIYESAPDSPAPAAAGGGSGSAMVDEALQGGGKLGRKEPHCGRTSVWHPWGKLGAITLFVVLAVTGITHIISGDSAAAPAAAADAHRHHLQPTTAGPNGETYFIKSHPRPLAANMEHAAVDLPLDYEVQLDITPGDSVVESFSNIIHFTATGNDCWCGPTPSNPGQTALLSPPAADWPLVSAP